MNDGRVILPVSVSELCEFVSAAAGPILALGGGTKAGLHNVLGAQAVGLRGLAGILEYEPSEFTFTARAGTTLAEVQGMLAEHGQYLPCDPLLVEGGGTLGGMIAAGTAGAGRMRYGGVRDFVVGVQFVDGTGALRRGGGKVVKNAAGFDFPKLFCGSLGRLGILTEVTCKVFPQARAQATLTLEATDLAGAVQWMSRAAGQMWEVETLEIAPPGTLRLRLGGAVEALAGRVEIISRTLPAGMVVSATDEEWRSLREFAWVPRGAMLVKVPTLARDLVALDGACGGAAVRFSQGGNVAWIGWVGAVAELDEILRQQGLTGLVWRGPALRLGQRMDLSLERRLKTTFDPGGRFPDFPPFLT